MLKRYWLQAKKYLTPIWNKIAYPSLLNYSAFKKRSRVKKVASLGYTILLLLFAFVFLLETNFLWLFGDMPTMKEARNPKLAVPSKILSADGVQMGAFFIENRKPIAFENIHPKTIDALIATEDVRFYEHSGIDFRAIGGAVLGLFSEDNRGGGSTITQQLVKNIYKTRAKSSAGLLGKIPFVKTVVAKTKEWVTALKMSYFFDKEEILTLYLNAVDFGDNSFGLKIASEHFFSKNPEDLELHESAVLIGVLKGTFRYNPVRNPERALARRNVVLEQMLKYKKINQEEYHAAIKQPLGLKITPFKLSNDIAPYFIAAIKPKLEKWCEEQGLNLYADGLTIYTTIDSRAQKHAEKAVSEHLAAHQKSLVVEQGTYTYWFDKTIAAEKAQFKKENPRSKTIPETATETLLKKLISQSPIYLRFQANGLSAKEIQEKMSVKASRKMFFHNGYKEVSISSIDSVKHMAQVLQAGLMSMDPTSGHVKAWVGGVDFNTFQYDHVSQASRQAGSAFKPLIYAAALEKGYTACTTVVDKPISLKTTIDGKSANWEPRNSTRTFTYAPMRLRSAIAQSVNSVAIQVLQDIKPAVLQSFVKKLGISTPVGNDLSIALGTNSVKLLEMVKAYAVFVNGGKLVEPVLYTKIESIEGDVLFESSSSKKQVYQEELAYEMTYMLRGGVEESGGTSRRLYNYNLPLGNQIGGKTGTTNDYVDAWYMGVTQPLVTGVWVGCEDSKIHFTSGNGQGGRSALPIFGMYMKEVYADKEIGIAKMDFKKPPAFEEKLPECLRNSYYIPDSSFIKTDSLQVDSLGLSLPADSLLEAI